MKLSVKAYREHIEYFKNSKVLENSLNLKLKAFKEIKNNKNRLFIINT